MLHCFQVLWFCSCVCSLLSHASLASWPCFIARRCSGSANIYACSFRGPILLQQKPCVADATVSVAVCWRRGRLQSLRRASRMMMKSSRYRGPNACALRVHCLRSLSQHLTLRPTSLSSRHGRPRQHLRHCRCRRWARARLNHTVKNLDTLHVHTMFINDHLLVGTSVHTGIHRTEMQNRDIERSSSRNMILRSKKDPN